MKPIVVVPVYNEAPTIGGVVALCREHAPVVVVDDGSHDASAAIARVAGADVVRHRRRLGKGQALRSGIAAARARGATHVITLDGDGQHDPRDLPVMLATIRQHPRTIVIGRRRGALPYARANAIRVAGFFANWVSGSEIADTQSGFRTYPVALFEDLHPRTGGFVFETEVLLESLRRGWTAIEVDVNAIPRTTRRSRFRPLVDGTAVGAHLARRVAARWIREAAAAVGETTSLVRRDVRRTRHATILAEASVFADAPTQWPLAVGVATGRRVAAGLVTWWRHPRLRRAGVAATATLATPLLASAALAQTVIPMRVLDLVTPLVDILYSQSRLERCRRSGSTPSSARHAAMPDDALVAPPPEAR
jgi:cellulose synthase/poly-beta-1,6-N-acetylglucosamine synthase-like glycosyltransferase